MVAEFPNVTKWVCVYLRAQLAGDYSTVRVSDIYKGSDVEVWVQRDGGPGLDQVREAARIRINCFHASPTSEAVDDLARRVSTLLRSCADGAPVVKATQTSGPSPIADTLPRRFLSFELIVRGTDLT
jgi:hypothetical protein